MPWTDKHLAWLHDTGNTVTTLCGKEVAVFEFRHDQADEKLLSAWATHFRNHYCLDDELPHLKPNEMTNSAYLIDIKFPNASTGFGPRIRAGDFSEILVADYLNFRRGYDVPRVRYERKIIADESSKGTDVIGFKQHKTTPSPEDELLVYEVKAALTEKSKANPLQDAIDHSSKDEVRLAESLNAIRQHFFDKGNAQGFSTVDRFQNGVDHPYKKRFGAAGVMTNTAFSEDKLSSADSSDHISPDDLELIAISGEQLMPLVHALYQRAADEA